MKNETGFIISRGPTSDWLGLRSLSPAKPVDQSQHLVDDPARPVQLRPLLGWERENVVAHPGNRTLVARASEPELRAFVRLPKKCRENTPANVERAIREVEKFSPSMGRLFRDALKAAPTAKAKG